MASKTDLKKRIDLDLDALFFEVNDIAELDDVWSEEPDHMRYSEMLAWNSCMSVLRLDLEPAYRNGQMTPEQQARYRDLLRRLKEALPILDKLSFSRPAVSLDSAAA